MRSDDVKICLITCVCILFGVLGVTTGIAIPAYLANAHADSMRRDVKIACLDQREQWINGNCVAVK